MVWESVSSPRIIKIIDLLSYNEEMFYSPGRTGPSVYSITLSPPILRTNKESRQVGLAKYSVAFETLSRSWYTSTTIRISCYFPTTQLFTAFCLILSLVPQLSIWKSTRMCSASCSPFVTFFDMAWNLQQKAMKS